jgi:hypothetical protein
MEVVNGMRTAPFLIKDVESLRRRAAEIERGAKAAGRDAELWRLMKNCARSSPDGFPWFTPFVALMTGEAQDIRNAKRVLDDYLEKLEPMYFTTGLQYHFWCFAFPHAKWCMYFQWLTTLGAYTPEEEAAIRGKLARYQFLNFFYGLRTKPEPECVDNQTLSLCLSNVLVGRLFAEGDDGPDPIARTMLEEGWRRLPDIVGGMPASGYSGEGSSYMDCVVGPAIPLIVELMEDIGGEKDVYFKSFAPNGVTPAKVLEMTAREWMPGGLLLPWDNYGYQYGVRAPLAYAARKTRDPLYADILLHDAVWSYDIGVGWAYDDLVWTWIWWPEERMSGGGAAGAAASKDSHRPGSAGLGQGASGPIAARSWADPDVGGAIAAPDYYLMQMWDDSAPVYPVRSHVNPNAVLFNAYGVPLSVDGETRTCPRFQFEDTWREVKLGLGDPRRYNYGDGCGGAHSVLLVDGWEGMRAMSEYKQHTPLALDPLGAGLAADVTPIYKERFPDAVHVRRRSKLAAKRFFVIEDSAVFTEPHRFTSRFILRPRLVSTERAEGGPSGAKIMTREGVTLHLLELSGGTVVKTEVIHGNHSYFPMDEETLLVDFNGTSGERLFVAFMSRTFRPGAAEEGWTTVSDPSEAWDYEEARRRLDASAHVVPFLLPAYMELPLPIARRWWYRKTIRKAAGPARLQLPRGMHNALCWINGVPADLGLPVPTDLLAPIVRIPEEWEDAREIEVVVRCDVPVSHFDGKGEGTIGINGGAALCYPCEEERILRAAFDGAHIEVQTNLRTYREPYRRMER